MDRFQKLTRQKLPFDHCGCTYSQTEVGFAITQKDFAMKLKPVKIPMRADDSKLSAGEITEFRSALGALPWITATRLDVISDVSLLQARATVAEIRDLKTANLVIEKVKQFADAGLHYSLQVLRGREPTDCLRARRIIVVEGTMLKKEFW